MSSLRFEEQSAWWREFRAANAGLFPWSMEAGEDGTEEPSPPPGEAAFAVHAAPRRDRRENFLDAVREGARLHCNVELGCSTMVAIKMGVEARRQGRVLSWDAAVERVVAT